jgi:hypothetical protein
MRCPRSVRPSVVERELFGSWLVSADRHYSYPVRGGIPRFVHQSNHADDFGVKWNHCHNTRLNSHRRLHRALGKLAQPSSRKPAWRYAAPGTNGQLL